MSRLRDRVALQQDECNDANPCWNAQDAVTAPLLLAWIFSAIVVQVAALVLVRAMRPPSGAASAPASGALPEPPAWKGYRPFRVMSRTFEDAAESQCSFVLSPVDGAALPPFRPGQYLTVSVTIPDADPDEPHGVLSRAYSISDRPHPDRYRLTIKRALPPAAPPGVPAGIVSAYFHDHVAPGSILQVKAPSGQFHVDETSDLPLVLIAGGIGITPMLSIISWCLDERPGREMYLFYGVRCGEDHAFKAVLQSLAAQHPALHLSVFYGAPGGSDVAGRDFMEAGFISIDAVRRLVPDGRHLYYVCGPPAMMQVILPGLSAGGVAPADIHFEAFGPASGRQVPATEVLPASRHVQVQFTTTGRTLTWTGASANLLDFAESHGVTIPCACRSGSCGSCETRLISGTVRYPEPPAWTVTAGHCLPCVGVPDSALVLEA